MKLLFLTLVFSLVSFNSIYAKYCSGNSSVECCPYAGLGKTTCPGVGTSDVSELIGYLIRGGETFGILGQHEGIYYIFGVSYNLLNGAEAVLVLNTLYAYIIEVPNEEGGHTYYYIAVGGCPSITTISGETKGTVASTRLPLASVYNLIIASNKEPDCDGPCNTVTGTSPPTRTGLFPELDLNIPLSFSNTYALQYHCLNDKYIRAPNDAIQKYSLDVEQGNCSSLYVQRGYMDGAELCYSSDRGTRTGRYLATHFDFKKLSQKNGLCLLVTLLNKLGASFPYPYYLYHEKLRLMAYPFKCAVTISLYLSEITGYQMNEPLANLC